MNLLGEYRMQMEEKELIAHALTLLEERHVNFWKTGIKIGNDLIGLTVHMPTGGPRDIKRVLMRPVSADETLKFESPKISEKPREYRKRKMEDLNEILSKMDIFYSTKPDYCEVTGKAIKPMDDLTHAFVERLSKAK